MGKLFFFPDPVNEKAARVVAGPTLSPLGWLAQNAVAPRLGQNQPMPGPPKRFAQGMGALMSTAARVLALVLGLHTAADVVLILFLPAAGLESIFGYCGGCKLFGLLMRAGILPERACAECADMSNRLRAPVS